MQLTFPFAPTTVVADTLPAVPAEEPMTVAEALHHGRKVTFPKDANAVRVTIGGKTAVVLKHDADTLQGAGIATDVAFGTVKNDARGHPVWKSFATLTETAARRKKFVTDPLADEPLGLVAG